jgi:hypothetical protein
MSNYEEFLRGISPQWGAGFWGRRFLGLLLGVTSDTIGVALSSAVQSPWFHLGGQQQADALPLLGFERNMPRYPAESNQDYRGRLWGAWDAWAFAGHESAIEGQLAAAGFTGEVYEPFRTHAGTGNTHGDWIREPLNYWSQFWVFFPQESGHGIGPPLLWGSGGLTWGSGWVWGTDATYETIATLVGIVEKWRPAHVICRQLLFELSGWSFGTGHVWGETGLVWGGEAIELTLN